MSKKSNIPIYKEMYKNIKMKIEKELYPVGMLLPNEDELREEYAVSRTTVRHAISLLQADGLIRVKQGYGTEVVNNKVSQSLNSITSVSESLRKMGREVGVCSMHIERISATYELAEELKTEVGAPVILVNRIQTSNGEPIAIAKNYILEKYVPEMINQKEAIVSLYQHLKEKYSIGITRVEDRISASNTTFDEAVALRVEPQRPLIVVRRVCFTSGIPFEFDYVKILANNYEYRNDFDMEGQR